MRLLNLKRKIVYNLVAILLLMPSMHILAFEKQDQSVKKLPTYKIAFNVFTDQATDNYEIFIMDLDGKNKQNISQNKAVDWVYYAFKDKLYFLSDRDAGRREFYLYSMKANGEQVEKISEIRLKDSWFDSRNQANEFVINPYGTDRPTFYIINRQGELLKTINPKLKFASDPLFTPDGQNIIFRGANFVSKKEPGFVDEIYICDLDGNILKQMTHYPKSDTSAKWYDYNAGTPNLNVNENFISYHSFQNGKYSLFATTFKGDKQWKLTTLKQDEGWHSWSADGHWLAIELFDTKQTQFHIGLLNWQTRQLKILTQDDYQYQQAPVFVSYD